MGRARVSCSFPACGPDDDEGDDDDEDDAGLPPTPPPPLRRSALALLSWAAGAAAAASASSRLRFLEASRRLLGRPSSISGAAGRVGRRLWGGM